MRCEKINVLDQLSWLCKRSGMKRFLGLISFLLFFQCSLAQNKLDIDSLLAAYEQQEGKTKLLISNNIVNYYMYRDIDMAGKYARAQLALAQSVRSDSAIALANYQMAVYHSNLNHTDSSTYYNRVSLELARKLEHPIYISQALNSLTILAFSDGDLLRADSINDINLAHCIQYKDSVGIALSYDLKGTINQNKGYYSIALGYVLKGLGLFQKLEDSIRIADCFNHLATLESNLKNYENAITYNEKALKIYEDYDDTYYQAQALNDIGVMYKNLKQEEKALDYYRRSIVKSKEAKVPALEAAALGNIGYAYVQLNRGKEAITWLNQSIELSKSLNANRRIAIAENQLAEAHLLLKNPASAIRYASNAADYAMKNENLSIHALAIKHLSTAYEQAGDLRKAINYRKQHQSLSDSLINREKVTTIEELRAKYDLATKESEIILQEEEIIRLHVQAENDRLTKTLYGLGMVSFIAISGLIFISFRQRIRKNQILYQKQEEILRQEIEFKKKELASQTLHLVQKSTFIGELKDNLEKIKQSPELFKIEFKRLIMLLKREHAEDQDWEVFKSYFSEVHNDFDVKLKSINSEITENEIRLASFLRMNLTTKEIASMQNVLPDSILKSKYRLKQKLNLSKEEDLNEFLNTL